MKRALSAPSVVDADNLDARLDVLELKVRELVMLLRVVVVVAGGNLVGHVLEALHPLG